MGIGNGNHFPAFPASVGADQTRPEIPSQATSITCSFPAFAAINFTGAQQQQPGTGWDAPVELEQPRAQPRQRQATQPPPPGHLTSGVRRCSRRKRSARGPAHMKVLARNIAAMAWVNAIAHRELGCIHVCVGVQDICPAARLNTKNPFVKLTDNTVQIPQTKCSK